MAFTQKQQHFINYRKEYKVGGFFHKRGEDFYTAYDIDWKMYRINLSKDEKVFGEVEDILNVDGVEYIKVASYNTGTRRAFYVNHEIARMRKAEDSVHLMMFCWVFFTIYNLFNRGKS